jgi:hypothetical protein
MAVAVNLSELEEYVKSALIVAMSEVGDKVTEVLKEHVDEDVYMQGAGANYYARGTMQPTFDLRESVTAGPIKVTSNTVSINVFNESTKMELDIKNFVHGSKYWAKGPDDIRSILPMIIEYGQSGPFFGFNWWMEPRPYYHIAIADLAAHKQHVDITEKVLKGFGFKVKRV